MLMLQFWQQGFNSVLIQKHAPVRFNLSESSRQNVVFAVHLNIWQTIRKNQLELQIYKVNSVGHACCQLNYPSCKYTDAATDSI